MGTKNNILLKSRKMRFTFRNILDGMAMKLTTRSTAKVVVFNLERTVFITEDLEFKDGHVQP